MRIEILDLGINNLSSIKKAITGQITSQDSCVSIETQSMSRNPDLIILPGLGHFESGMAALARNDFVELLNDQNERGTKIVGICLGMQLLCKESEEAPGIKGLSLISGKVKLLPPGEPIPHIGWNEVRVDSKSEIFPSLASNRDFYFVHSFAVELEKPSEIVAKTKFADKLFVSSFKYENILGFQFHPEKSGRVGEQLLSEVVSWAK